MYYSNCIPNIIICDSQPQSCFQKQSEAIEEKIGEGTLKQFYKTYKNMDVDIKA